MLGGSSGDRAAVLSKSTHSGQLDRRQWEKERAIGCCWYLRLYPHRQADSGSLLVLERREEMGERERNKEGEEDCNKIPARLPLERIKVGGEVVEWKGTSRGSGGPLFGCSRPVI